MDIQRAKTVLNDCEGGSDRISELPDSVLCHILSLLPTKSAVATSVLSTRWKSLFPFFWFPPIKLDLDDTLLLHLAEQNNSIDASSRFIDFVDKLLSETLSEVPSVETVRLYCKKLSDETKLLAWVCSAVRLRVRELIVHISLEQSRDLFNSINGCLTLVRLSINIASRLAIPHSFSLLYLKSLQLSELSFDDNRDIQKIFEGCPVLEDLSLIDCDFGSWQHLSIHSLLLKHLNISDSSINDDNQFHLYTPHLQELLFNSSARFDLHAPNLQQLMLRSMSATNYRIPYFKYSLVANNTNAGLTESCVGTYYFDRGISELVAAFSSIACLHLDACSIDALGRSSFQLPEFRNLTVLYLGSFGWYGWAFLARLLWVAPNLKELTFEETFEVSKGFGKYEGCYAEFEGLLPIQPACLESQIKKIKFCVFKWKKDEVSLLEYFLKNSKALDKVVLPQYPTMSIMRRLPNNWKIVLESR